MLLPERNSRGVYPAVLSPLSPEPCACVPYPSTPLPPPAGPRTWRVWSPAPTRGGAEATPS